MPYDSSMLKGTPPGVSSLISAAPKILKTNQFYFLFVPDCAACNIQVVKIRQSMLRAAEPKDETPKGVPFYDWRITRHRE